MAEYTFNAKASNGKIVKGTVEANSEVEARVKIRAQRLMPTKIMLKSGCGGGAATKNKSNASVFLGSVKPKELQVFTRQFAVLIGAGVPVVQSIEAMIGGGRSPLMNQILKEIVEDVGKGKRLADAMVKHPKAFDRMYVNVVRAGEEGGVLDTMLNRQATYIEKSVALRGKVTGALWYPAIIIVVAFIVIALILIFVIPSFVSMFSEAGQELPKLTQLVIFTSDYAVKYWYAIILTPIILIFSLKYSYGTDDGRKVMDRIVIDLPIFGELIQKSSIARFSRTLATLLKAGVRIVEALDVAVGVAKNYVIETTLLEAKESINKGRTIYEPFEKSKYIPDMVTQMISVGEQTGSLDTMLEKVADFFEDEVESTAGALTSMIEPLLMVFLGGIIAVLVGAMYLPIFNMSSAIGG